jgi:hypothetical protein
VSARRATPEARCVWLTTEFFDIHSDVEASEALQWLAGQFAAAPADPVEAVLAAIRRTDGLASQADAVLVALGFPLQDEA